MSQPAHGIRKGDIQRKQKLSYTPEQRSNFLLADGGHLATIWTFPT